MTADLKAKCPYGNPAAEVCTSQHCNRFNPFICNNICKESQCYTNHRGCKFISWFTCKKKLTTTKLDKGQNFQDFTVEVEEIYDKLMGMVEFEKQKFRIWHTTLGLNPKIIRFMEDIAQQKYNLASGSHIHQLLAQGNPATSGLQLKKLNKIDNLFFREIEKCQNEVLDMVSRIYMQPIMKEYFMKNDQVDPPVELQSKKIEKKPQIEKEEFYQKHKLTIMELNQRIHEQQLDAHGLLIEGPGLRLIPYVSTGSLRILVLTDNRLKSIEDLPQCNLSNLQHLFLDYNSIVDIEPLRKCRIPLLELLRLDYNQIVNIEPLASCQFPLLQSLNLNYNQIVSIAPLASFQFPKLRTLLAYDNNVADLSPLLVISLPSLQLLQIYGNKARSSDTEKIKERLQDKFPGLVVKLSV